MIRNMRLRCIGSRAPSTFASSCFGDDATERSARATLSYEGAARGSSSNAIASRKESRAQHAILPVWPALFSRGL